MTVLERLLEEQLPEAAAAWLRDQQVDAGRIPVLFPGLPRRMGRDLLDAGLHTEGERRVDLGAWRRCDLAALLLLQKVDAGPDLLLELFRHGDLEERSMVLRSLSLLPLSAATAELLGEAQRTNTVSHFSAAVLDSNLAACALADRGCAFDQADFERLVIKLAFSDLPLGRLYDAARGASPELSRMAQDLATEREAAGRRVWTDTWRLISWAPASGSIPRLLGGLEHGDDDIRMAAVEGLIHLNRPEHHSFGHERLTREPRPEIRDALSRWLGAS